MINKYPVVLRRDYMLHEEATLTVKANSPEQAIRKMRDEIEQGELDIDWIEVDGGEVENSYVILVLDEEHTAILLEETLASE